MILHLTSLQPHLLPIFISLPYNTLLFITLRKKTFEKIVGKGENAGNQHFLLFPQSFLPVRDKNHHFNNFQSVASKGLEFGSVQRSAGEEISSCRLF